MSPVNLFLVFLCCCGSYAARILGIFPTPSHSHPEPMQVVMEALARRGHQITVISPEPLKIPRENYTYVDVSFSYEHLRNAFDFTTMPTLSGPEFFSLLYHYFLDLCELQVSSKPVQDFTRSNQGGFDLVIYEPHGYQCYFGLYHKVGSPPLVGMFSLGPPSPTLWAVGNPDHPAYSPDWFNTFSDHMSFWERMYSTAFKLWASYLWNYELMPKHENVIRKYFGDGFPPAIETDRNMSLLFVYNHWTLDYPRPLLPNVVQITGLHVKRTPTPLPQKIKLFLDEAKEGVIYFSLGTNLRSDRLSKENMSAILEVFAELPQRVIWKWESDTLSGQPSNVMVAKWLPQQDILAHPNTRAFIFQGGLQSLQEAAYHGIPMVGIPFFADQEYNIKKVVSAGIGVKLSISDLTKATFFEALDEVLSNSRYRSNMQVVSAVFREEADISLDRAIWWIEYILRHNGAPHLRSAALDLTWYQYLLLDVVGVVVIAALFAIGILYGSVRVLYAVVCKDRRRSKEIKKNK